jgi:hypothetical protein
MPAVAGKECADAPMAPKAPPGSTTAADTACCGAQAGYNDWGSKMDVILPMVAVGLVASVWTWLLLMREEALGIDEYLCAAMVGSVALVMLSFWFMPKYHGEAGTAMVVVGLPFGSLAVACIRTFVRHQHAWRLHAWICLELCMFPCGSGAECSPSYVCVCADQVNSALEWVLPARLSRLVMSVCAVCTAWKFWTVMLNRQHSPFLAIMCVTCTHPLPPTIPATEHMHRYWQSSVCAPSTARTRSLVFGLGLCLLCRCVRACVRACVRCRAARCSFS